jgi:hypothetical protein
VPLIYPGNVRSGIIEWPREIRKDQAFAVRLEAEQKKFLLPAGFYVFVKRFSAKEERQRVVAAVWDSHWNTSAVAFENHLNIFHANGAGLDRDLAVGLSLVSRGVDVAVPNHELGDVRGHAVHHSVGDKDPPCVRSRRVQMGACGD